MAENIRTDKRVDGFARDNITNLKEAHVLALAAKEGTITALKETNKSQRLQLRIAAALIIFLVGAIVFRELGFSVGADGLDFDGPFFNSTIDFNPAPGFFPSYTPAEDDLIAFGGTMPDFSFAGNFVFHIDVPDGISSFTLRQSPLAVPEPGTFVLTSLGLICLARCRRGGREGRRFPGS